MFEILPDEIKSLAVRTKVRYVSARSDHRNLTRLIPKAPHPYVWMSSAHALPTGLGIENEGLELPLDQLPEWDESKIKTFPLVSHVLARGEFTS